MQLRAYTIYVCKLMERWFVWFKLYPRFCIFAHHI